MESLVDFIRLFSKAGRLVTLAQVAAVAGIDIDIEAIEDIKAAHQQLIADSRYQDIQLIAGDCEPYFYSEIYIVSSYAKQWLGVKQGNVLATMAEDIRRFSAVGALLPEDNFCHPPYNLSDDERQQLLAQLAHHPEHQDIGLCQDNSGAGHYFSTRHLSACYAQILANHDPFEWSV